MNPLDRLADRTYAMQHSPNCPSPYLIRVIGQGKYRLDLEYYDTTKDRLCFGVTLEEAVQKAIAK